MKVKQTKTSVNVVIKEDTQTFLYFKSLIEKNFKNKLANKNKIIIFNDPNEEVSRRYFLKLLSKIYARKAAKKLKRIWQIEKAVDKSIKISLIQKNQIQQVVKIAIKYNKMTNSIEISMDKKNRFILRGIKNIFKNYEVTYYPSMDKTYIQNIDKNFGIVLQHFISTREILGIFLDIKYDDGIFDEINEENLKKIDKKNRRANILLDDFYKKLNCNSKDPYDKIRKSYLLLTKKYHPDAISNDNEIILKVYRKKFQEIQQAYKTIKEYHRYIGNVA